MSCWESSLGATQDASPHTSELSDLAAEGNGRDQIPIDIGLEYLRHRMTVGAHGPASRTTWDGDAYTLAVDIVLRSPAAIHARCAVVFSLEKTSVRATANSHGVARESLTVPSGRSRTLPFATGVSGKGSDEVSVQRAACRS